MTRMGRRENWESLRIFVACGRHLSFTTAAAHLGLTQAAVSQRISELERRFRVRLFSRRPRLALTPSGERLLPRIEQAFTAIDRALTELSQPRLLTITTTQSFAMLWLLPRLSRFRRFQPDISVAVEASDDLRSFDDERLDLAIRTVDQGRPLDKGPDRGATLFPLELTPVASAALLSRHHVRSPADLARLPLLADRAWSKWFRSVGIRAQPSARRAEVLLYSQQLALPLVMAGESVALLSPRFVREHLAKGRLVQPFKQTIADGEYRAVWRAGRGDSQEVEVFRQWLLREVQADT